MESTMRPLFSQQSHLRQPRPENTGVGSGLTNNSLPSFSGDTLSSVEKTPLWQRTITKVRESDTAFDCEAVYEELKPWAVQYSEIAKGLGVVFHEEELPGFLNKEGRLYYILSRYQIENTEMASLSADEEEIMEMEPAKEAPLTRSARKRGPEHTYTNTEKRPCFSSSRKRKSRAKSARKNTRQTASGLGLEQTMLAKACMQRLSRLALPELIQTFDDLSLYGKIAEKYSQSLPVLEKIKQNPMVMLDTLNASEPYTAEDKEIITLFYQLSEIYRETGDIMHTDIMCLYQQLEIKNREQLRKERGQKALETKQQEAFDLKFSSTEELEQFITAAYRELDNALEVAQANTRKIIQKEMETMEAQLTSLELFRKNYKIIIKDLLTKNSRQEKSKRTRVKKAFDIFELKEIKSHICQYMSKVKRVCGIFLMRAQGDEAFAMSGEFKHCHELQQRILQDLNNEYLRIDPFVFPAGSTERNQLQAMKTTLLSKIQMLDKKIRTYCLEKRTDIIKSMIELMERKIQDRFSSLLEQIEADLSEVSSASARLKNNEALIVIDEINTAKQILDCDSQAEWPQIRKAYIKMALKYHPDKNPSDEAKAEDEFKKINEAYILLQEYFQQK